MKKFALVVFVSVFAFLFSGILNAKAYYPVRVGGYYRASGTYVRPYYRTSPDSSRYNNYSSYGNYNPYTGKVGHKKWY